MTGEARLRAVLDRARAQGYLGPGDPAVHLAHARGFANVTLEVLGHMPRVLVDLGSGGGVPGLVLAHEWPDARGVLVEVKRRRADHLRQACDELGLADRVEVVQVRAEELAHDPAYRELADLVTARGFGYPAVAAEIGTAFVKVGGVLVVSEPPAGDPPRWPAAALAAFGLEAARILAAGDFTYAALAKRRTAGEDVPRAVGRPAKRPRW